MRINAIAIAALAALATSSAAAAPVCNAEQCPLNQNSLVWENDRFGAYLYGPGNYHCWSGVDIFNKLIYGSAAVEWSKDPALNDCSKHPNLHENSGQGMDNYTLGAGRGVGAVALWADGEWKTFGPWEKFEIVHTGDDYVEFKVVYPAFSALGKMTYRIVTKKGDNFYRNDVSFEFPDRFGSDWRVGPGLDLNAARDHKGDLKEEKGLVSLFEDSKDVLGQNKSSGPEGSTMSAIFVKPAADVEMLTDNQKCRVIGFKQANFSYCAGCAWSLAKQYSKASDWHQYIQQERQALDDKTVAEKKPAVETKPVAEKKPVAENKPVPVVAPVPVKEVDKETPKVSEPVKEDAKPAEKAKEAVKAPEKAKEVVKEKSDEKAKAADKAPEKAKEVVKAAPKVKCTVSSFGKLSDGREARLWSFVSPDGLRMDFSDYGGRLVRAYAPDRNGKLADVTLGWNTPREYETQGLSMSTLIGRYGNRIKDGKFKLDGKEYQLPVNDVKPSPRHNCLHGGPKGWDSKIWNAKQLDDGIEFSLVSPDGDMGFPGTVKAKVTYRLLPNNVWSLDYEATTDKPTVINLTHHSYWNLAGESSGTVLNHELKIFADKYTLVDDGLIPIRDEPVADTGFDFREWRRFGHYALWMSFQPELEATGNWYDHNFVLRGEIGKLHEAVFLRDPASGRTLEIWTTEPCLQMFGSQNMDGSFASKQEGYYYKQYSGIVFETQHHPDAPNHPEFPSTVLRPGQTYKSHTEYRFGVTK